jgi:hypothetical protein
MPRFSRRKASARTALIAAGRESRPRSSERESVASVVVVFLIFLVVGIEAEGFPIPTGSIAPTLLGRHKEITCPRQRLVYTVNADWCSGSNSPWSRGGRAWEMKDQYDPSIPGWGWDRSGRSRWEIPSRFFFGKVFCVS